MTSRWRPILLSLLLFALNAYICREFFAIEFIRNLDSNEGVFVAISRFFRDHWGERWYPWFNVGMPIENAYQPLLPMAAALAGQLTGWSVERAFHFVMAMAYCCGPVALFWFAWEWSESLLIGSVAAFAYSLCSPAEMLIPILRVRADGHWAPLRLYNLVHYAEDPHIAALTLLPVALLFLRRAVVRGGAADFAAAVAFSGAVVLTNGFGALDLAIGGLSIALATNRGAWTLLSTGLVAWFWISPWLPPSLIGHIRANQWGTAGYFSAGLPTWLTIAGMVSATAVLWCLTRRLTPFERFSIPFALWMTAIPLGYFQLNVTLAPQSSRYQLELEMALCLAAACLCARLPWRAAVVALLLIFAVRQTAHFRHFARGLIQPAAIATTIQYKVSKWIDRSLPGQRTMIAGDPEFLFNVLSDNPQMSAGHDPTAPNWMQRVAVYAIYSGDGAGDRDADYSIFWLKAFGNQAIYVPGPGSRESAHGVLRPHKFDGILPVLWHEEDDTIFGVPQRSPSLAHVIPKEAEVLRQPIHGLDLDPARAYVAALDDASLPVADLAWTSPSAGVVAATMKRGPGALGAGGLGPRLARPHGGGRCSDPQRRPRADGSRSGLRRPVPGRTALRRQRGSLDLPHSERARDAVAGGAILSAMQGPVFPQQFVKNHAARGRDVQRMFEAQHGNPHVGIGQRRDLRSDAFGFVAKHHAHREPRPPIEQIHRVHAGFDHGDFATGGLKRSDLLSRLPGVLPRDGQLGAESRLRNHPLRRVPGDARQIQPLDTDGVGRPKKGADVIEAADVFEQNRDRQRPDTFIRHARRGRAER